MKLIKRTVRKVLRAIDPALEARALDQYSFNRLRRSSAELQWKALPRCPVALLDAGGLQLRDKLFVFGGFRQDSSVLSTVHVFDLATERWTAAFAMPPRMPQSHLGMACDGKRFMYAISGQFGDQCHPPSPLCFVLDTQTGQWSELPPLPEARYAATVAIWRDRLHVVGGSRPDRNTPAVDHWSIAVDSGRAREKKWREEIPIPRGGPHRATVVVDDRLFVFGGQEGDYVAIPGDPEFTCTGDLTCETMHAETYVLERGAADWKRLSDMPIASSHTEFSRVLLGRTVVLVGGQHAKDPETKRITLTDAVQAYDTAHDRWKIVGRMPYSSKSCVVAYRRGWLYMTTGQRDKGDGDPTPGDYDERTWKARIRVD